MAGFKVEELAQFPPNSNPFEHDFVRMGVSVGTNPLVMYERHNDNRYIVIVDQKTGRRLRVEMPSE